jgi:hypothetical protein
MEAGERKVDLAGLACGSDFLRDENRLGFGEILAATNSEFRSFALGKNHGRRCDSALRLNPQTIL